MLTKLCGLVFRLIPDRAAFLMQCAWEAKLSNAKRSQLLSCGQQTSIAGNAIIVSPHRVTLGSKCMLNEYVHIIGGGTVTIGDGVWVANHASIISIIHPPDVEFIGDAHPDEHDDHLRPVHIEDNVWIGSHAIIMPGVRLGRSCIVGSGSVVTKDVPPYAIVGGVPAKLLRYKSIAPALSGAE